MEALTVEMLSPWEPGLLSILVYAAMVGALMGVFLFLTYWLGEKKAGTEKLRPYECGVIPTGSARLHLPVPFYLVAIFFLIFDIEGVFIFSWAVANQALGLAGWLEIAFFILLLMFGLAYIWRKGGLEWGQRK